MCDTLGAINLKLRNGVPIYMSTHTHIQIASTTEVCVMLSHRDRILCW